MQLDTRSRRRWIRLFIFLSVLTPIGIGAQTEFAAPLVYTATEEAELVVTGDLDGDGDLDIVVSDESDSQCRIFHNDGNGELSLAGFVSGVPAPRDLHLVDINVDGFLDLVTTSFGGACVNYGLSNGLFEPQDSFLSNGTGGVIAIADVDGDSLLDLVGTHFLQDTVSLVLGSGPGQFLPPLSSPAGNGPRFAGVGDFNGDGVLEIVSSSQFSGDLRIFQYSPVAGTLTEVWSGPDEAVSFAVADVDLDGRAEILTLDSSYNLRIRHFDLNFAPESVQSNSPGLVIDRFEVADVDGDGAPDLIAPHRIENAVSVSWGAGTPGVFPSFELIRTGGSPTAIAVGTLDTDPLPDLAVIHDPGGSLPFPWGSLSIVRATAPREFLVPDQTEAYFNDGVTSERTHAADHGDFDGDGIFDLVVGARDEPLMKVFRGLEDGTLELSTNVSLSAVGGAGGIAVGEIDGAPGLDLVATDVNANQLRFYSGNGLSFGFLGSLLAPSDPGTVAIADFDGNGISDIVCMGNSTTRVYLDNGPGSFTPGPSLPFGIGATDGIYGNEGAIVAEDLDGDGNVDLALGADGPTAIYWGDGAGGFTSGFGNFAGSRGGLAYGDLTGDGFGDLIGVTWNEVMIWPQLNFGLTGLITITLPVDGLEAPTVTDLDGDGHLDLVLADSRRAGVLTLFGPLLDPATTCTGAEPKRYATAEEPWIILPSDLEGDGDIDLRVVCRHADRITTLKSSFPADCDLDGISDPCEILFGSPDIDLDELPDECETAFIRGDAQSNGVIDLADPIRVLNYLFENGPSECIAAYDANGDDRVDVADPVRLLQFLFSNGPAPPAPFPDCGLLPVPLPCDVQGCP